MTMLVWSQMATTAAAGAPNVAATQTSAVAPQPTATVATPAVVTPAVPAKVEAPAEPAKPAQDERLQALQRKERALVAREQAVKAQSAKVADMEAKLADAQKRLGEFDEFSKQIKLSPLEILKKYGVTYDDLTEAQLQGGKTASLEARAVRDEVGALKAQIAKRDEEAAAAKAKQAEIDRQEAAASFQADVDATVEAMADQFPLTSLYKAGPTVAKYMRDEFARTGEVISYKAAIEKVEAAIDADLERGQAIRTKKKAPPAPAVTPGAEKPAEVAQPRTVTNELTTSTAGITRAPRSEKERIAAAMAALERSSPQTAH